MYRWTRFRQRFSSWIAIFAVLLSALAPTISRATANEETFAWLEEICSADGLRYIVVNETSPNDNDASRGHSVVGDCCLYCVTHAGSFGLAPQLFSAIPPVSFHAEAASSHFSAPFLKSRLWAIAVPRGPPASPV